MEFRRKFFHLLLFAFPLAYLRLDRAGLLAALAVCWAVDAAAEGLRLKHPGFNAWVLGWFSGIYRQEEKTRLSGVFFALLGFIGAVFLYERQAAMAAMVCLVAGDAASSLARVGPTGVAGPKNWRSLAACFAACLAGTAWWLAWPAALGGALAAAVVERWAGGRLDDNLAIPLLSGVVIQWILRWTAGY